MYFLELFALYLRTIGEKNSTVFVILNVLFRKSHCIKLRNVLSAAWCKFCTFLALCDK